MSARHSSSSSYSRKCSRCIVNQGPRPHKFTARRCRFCISSEARTIPVSRLPVEPIVHCEVHERLRDALMKVEMQVMTRFNLSKDAKSFNVEMDAAFASFSTLIDDAVASAANSKATYEHEKKKMQRAAAAKPAQRQLVRTHSEMADFDRILPNADLDALESWLANRRNSAAAAAAAAAPDADAEPEEGEVNDDDEVTEQSSKRQKVMTVVSNKGNVKSVVVDASAAEDS